MRERSENQAAAERSELRADIDGESVFQFRFFYWVAGLRRAVKLLILADRLC